MPSLLSRFGLAGCVACGLVGSWCFHVLGCFFVFVFCLVPVRIIAILLLAPLYSSELPLELNDDRGLVPNRFRTVQNYCAIDHEFRELVSDLAIKRRKKTTNAAIRFHVGHVGFHLGHVLPHVGPTLALFWPIFAASDSYSHLILAACWSYIVVWYANVTQKSDFLWLTLVFVSTFSGFNGGSRDCLPCVSSRLADR